MVWFWIICTNFFGTTPLQRITPTEPFFSRHMLWCQALTWCQNLFTGFGGDSLEGKQRLSPVKLCSPSWQQPTGRILDEAFNLQAPSVTKEQYILLEKVLSRILHFITSSQTQSSARTSSSCRGRSRRACGRHCPRRRLLREMLKVPKVLRSTD